jgi:hypothetical protein
LIENKFVNRKLEKGGWSVPRAPVIKTCSSFGNLKMNANEGVQSLNFEVGQKFTSFKEFESQRKHYQDAKFIQMYRRGSCKIESTKIKQTIPNNDLCKYIYEVYFISF